MDNERTKGLTGHHQESRVTHVIAPDVQDIIDQNKHKIMYIGPQNGKIVQILHLLNNTKPNPEKLFVVEGIWAHQKLVATDIKIRSFVFCPEFIYQPESVLLLKAFIDKTDDVYCVSEKVFAKISERDKQDGLLTIGEFPVHEEADLPLRPQELVVVLDGLEIPGNIGTIMRTCDGAAVDAVLICNRRARLTHPKILKGSMGAAFTLPVVEYDSVEACKTWLNRHKFAIYLADTRAEKAYYQYDYRGRAALIVGSERYGITREWYDGPVNMLSIPMLGACDSLNVGVATSIIMYEMSLKQKRMK